MKGPNRSLMLSLLLLMELMIGGHYAWSIYSRELITKHAFTATQSQITYSVYHLCFALALLYGGRALEKYGPRFTGMTGGAVFGAGYILAGLLPVSVFGLSVSIGMLAGAGSGFCYITTLATVQKWFEDKKALATGAIVSFFAFGAVLVSFLAELLLGRGVPIRNIFLLLGVSYFFLLTLSASFLKNPENYKSNDLPMAFKAILKDRNILAMTIPMFSGLFAGLMITGSLKNIGASRNIEYAGIAVMLISAFNGAGRLLWGWIIHVIGEQASIILSLSAQAIILFTSVFWINGPVSFFIFAALVGLIYGCTLVVFASNVSRVYGVKHLSSIYGFMFLTNGAAGIGGPIIAGLSKDLTGNYNAAIIIAAAVCVIGLAVFKGMYREVKS